MPKGEGRDLDSCFNGVVFRVALCTRSCKRLLVARVSRGVLSGVLVPCYFEFSKLIGNVLGAVVVGVVVLLEARRSTVPLGKPSQSKDKLPLDFFQFNVVASHR